MGNTNGKSKHMPSMNKMGMMAPVSAMGTVDAPVGMVDAPVGMVDAPVGMVDAPVGVIDAPVGAPTTLGPVYPPEITMPETVGQNGNSGPPSAFEPSNCQLYWKQTFANMGSMGNYPRPQGNLPMFNWGLTKQAQENMGAYYKQAFQGYGN